MNSIIKIAGINIKNILMSHADFIMDNVFEIRIRINSPVFVKTTNGNYFIDQNSKSKCSEEVLYKITKHDIDGTIASLTSNSIHAFENEILKGYFTIEGGHRVGIGGDCIYEKNNFKGFKNITSLNIRVAKEFKGCSSPYIKYLIHHEEGIYNTLIVGPPMSGKTTFIRDVARILSDGNQNPYFAGCDVTVIDERGEISSVYNGVPQMSVGSRTDVLSYCLKTEGFVMSIRALSPKVIIADELGSKDDFEIVQYALKSGVNIITTAHGNDIEDLKRNIYMKDIINSKFFDRIIVLKSSKTPSCIKTIHDNINGSVIYDDDN